MIEVLLPNHHATITHNMGQTPEFVSVSHTPGGLEVPVGLFSPNWNTTVVSVFDAGRYLVVMHFSKPSLSYRIELEIP